MQNNFSRPFVTTPSLKTEFETLHDYHYRNLILMTISINGVLSFVTTILNLMIIVTFAKTPSLREVPSNILILGLAVSDFGVGVVAQPLFCVLKLVQLKGDARLTEAIDTLFICSCYVLTSVSFLTVTAITVDRFLAIKLHLRYNELVTTKRHSIALVLIWIVCSFNIALKDFYKIQIFFNILTAILCSILFLNICLLFKISRIVRSHSLQIQAQERSVEQAIDIPRYKKSVNTIYYVVGAFVLCYVLYIVKMIGLNFVAKTQNMEVFFAMAVTIAMFNSVINPLIYCWRIEEMRLAAKKIIRGICRRGEYH
ncbi:melanocyte-stimulating hormone receptor-like [Actinia tenebrosa]|uniref:Melanocyte-stimulating hormone receptor-like n=1 Tax=Actinia tenebrosa TaxID=6105 RepID=A0A6P8HNE3_ACTTE|nr:melanocyte-stimulating hormone receptor-like [Actinia tenebrosa]